MTLIQWIHRQGNHEFKYELTVLFHFAFTMKKPWHNQDPPGSFNYKDHFHPNTFFSKMNKKGHMLDTNFKRGLIAFTEELEDLAEGK